MQARIADLVCVVRPKEDGAVLVRYVVHVSEPSTLASQTKNGFSPWKLFFWLNGVSNNVLAMFQIRSR